MARIIDVIEVPDQGATELVRRVPENGSGDFRLGSQAIVRESQRAVFYRDGHSLDVLGPGRHTITTMNLPVISSLMQLGTGGRDVFTSEVYLVNMREFTDQKWGTPQPITLRDSEFGLVRLRGFGQYSMQIADPKLFVDKVVGTQGLYTTAQIEDYLRGAIVSRMTDVLGSNMTSVLDLPKMYDDLNAAVRAKVASDFAAMGIDLKQFMIVNMSPTEETAKAIDERASMGAIGNLDAYMKFKAAQAMGDAAKAGGDAGAGLSLGAGIGMGTGMAGMVASAMQSAQSSSAAAAQPAAAPTASSVMTVEEAAAYLKVAPADIQAMIASGDLRAKKIGEQYRISKETIDSFLNS